MIEKIDRYIGYIRKGIQVFLIISALTFAVSGVYMLHLDTLETLPGFSTGYFLIIAALLLYLTRDMAYIPFPYFMGVIDVSISVFAVGVAIIISIVDYTVIFDTYNAPIISLAIQTLVYTIVRVPGVMLLIKVYETCVMLYKLIKQGDLK